MRKKFLVVFLILVLSLFNLKIGISADSLTDPADIFQVSAPGANQRVSGIININWRMFDNEQTVIPYTARILDGATCKNTSYGNINSNGNGISSATQDNVLQWNTKNTLSTNLSDGFYCLQICASLKKGAEPYSACNSRIVAIVNENKGPIIKSAPSGLTIKESDAWQYQLQVTNQSGRALKYYFIYGTNFLNINQNGLVQTNSNPKTLGPGITRANYNVSIAVDDGLYAPAVQQFTISIVKDTPVVSSSSSSSTVSSSSSSTSSSSVSSQASYSSNSSSSDSSQVEPYQIVFKTPDENTIFSGKTNKIEWNLSSFSNVNYIALNYSDDLEKWNKIAASTDDLNIYTKLYSTSSYLWDVSKIPDGSYYIQIILKDRQGSPVSKISKKFQIKNKAGNPEQGSIPLIVNVQPENEKIVTNNSVVISGNFTPSAGNKIDPKSFKLTFDDQEITSACTVTEEGFKCKSIDNLSEGKHKIAGIIQDSSKQVGTYTSVFIVNLSSNPLSYASYPVASSGLPGSTIIVLFIICLLLLILLIIPWMLYNFWLKNSKRTLKKTTITETLTPAPGGYDVQPLDTSSLTSYSADYQQQYAPNPNIITNYYKPYTPAAEPIAPAPQPQVNVTVPTDPNFDYNAAVKDNQQYVEPTSTDK